MISKLIKENILSLVVICTVFILIYSLNHMTLYVADDFVYRFVYQTNPSPSAVPINGIISILYSQIRHYEIWNGRFVAHSLVQFFMQFDKSIFDIFNTIAFITIGILVLMVVKSISNINETGFAVLITFMTLWLIVPEFGSSVLWVSGSMNYLWMSIIYTTFILISMREKRPGALTLILYLALSFLAGATNENSGPASALIVLMIVFLEYIRNGRISWWKLIGTALSIAGFALMMSSPGSQKRGGSHFSLEIFASHFYDVLQSNISLFLPFYTLFILLFVLCIYKNIVSKRDVDFTIIFLTGHFASIYSMVAAPSFPERTAFGAAIMLSILLIHYICKISPSSVLFKALAFSLYTSFVATYTYAATDIYNTYKELMIQVNVIHDSQPGSDIVVPMISKPKSQANAYKNAIYLTHRKNSWMNMWAARFYNMNSISGKD
ncbi:TPA: hypothetical protein QIE98_000295 [Enterobacter hormaechei subsp. steigerwaltii]|nr:hypothetical protein [Enterobacter hormaechei subsp. steigerwaltii]